MLKPCKNCPFKTTDDAIKLARHRRNEITKTLLSDGHFPCHKTTEHDDDGNFVNFHNSTTCIGAAILLEKVNRDRGGCRANLTFRLASGSGEFEAEKLDMTSPVYDSFNGFLSYIWD